ncbi:MAG: Rpn family recombination-promoting nuclease/putative transposase [Hyalangium sp.]|uniref:Rpn family recombination-promoting nuclease/putative transposase n=1 Tax=Hyalangium sp. TaxID=2028555 RepID=UPI00389B04C3
MSGPHDLFVRRTFSHPELAAAELRAVLPPQVVSQVDWSTLRRESGSVVDPELKETESDLLFSARLSGGRPVLLYLLLEHQSSVDRWMALRMLRYVVRQLEHWRKEHAGSGLLPVIIPLVMYHGPGGAWSAPRQIEELFDVPGEGALSEEWRALLPRFEYLVDDLTSERAEALLARPGPPQARLALLALRYGRTEELAQQLPRWAALFAQVRATPNGLEELSGVFHYLLLVGERSVRGATVGMLKSVVGSRRTEELMLTWGEEHFEQGRQKGLSEGLSQGRAEGRAEDVLRILAARGVQVDDQARQRILSCTDLATLDQWFDRALKATRLAEVLEDRAQ